MKTILLFIITIFPVVFASAQQTVEFNSRPVEKDSGMAAGQSISTLRASRPVSNAGRALFITDAGKQGFMTLDPGDKNSVDDSAMVFVTANGMRYKRVIDDGIINARWFGAMGNGAVDDWPALQKAIDFILSNNNTGRTLFLPPGTYKISRPLLIAKLQGGAFRQTAINLVGPANSKSLAAGFATISPTFNNTFAIGIQLGKGVLIKDLQIQGRFVFPSKLSPIQIDTLPASKWTDGSTRDNPLSPYAGIVIDPFCDKAAFANKADMYPGLEHYYPSPLGRGGSSSIQIIGCAINNFIVGVMLTPSNQQNADLVDVIDCDISYNKVSYAMGQAQSKECHVDRLKCWGATHTIFDNVGYGFRHGDGANIPMVDGVNIAGNIKQLCRIHAGSFNGVFRNVYAEGLFRIGYVGGTATVSFEDCQFNFATLDPSTPYPDFFVLGRAASFHSCMLRLYAGVPGYRLNLSGTNNYYEGGCTNEPPVAVNIDYTSIYPNPTFKNVVMYYSGGILGSSNHGIMHTNAGFEGSNGMQTDPVYYGNTYQFLDPDNGSDVLYKTSYNDGYERTVQLSGSPVIHVSSAGATGYFKVSDKSDINLLQENDILLTYGLRYQDQFTDLTAPTYPVGFIQRIGHDTVYLRNIAHGIHDGVNLQLWADYYVMAYDLFTGDMAAGSNIITKVQGRFPAIGERPDIPMVATGTFVVAVDKAAGTIRLSNPNKTGKSFSDYTFMNGYPRVEMYSAFDIPRLLQDRKTLIGGSDYYRLQGGEQRSTSRQFLLNGRTGERARIVNTNIKGDVSVHKMEIQAVK